MKSWSIPRTRRWPSSADPKKNSGSMSFVTVFIFLIFSILGMSLIYLSQIYLKISACKKNSLLLEYASENGIKKEFQTLLDLIAQAPSPRLLTPEKIQELRDDAKSGGTRIIEEALETVFPLTLAEGWKNISWQSQIRWEVERVDESKNFFIAVGRAAIISEGAIKNYAAKRKSSLTAKLGILGGQVPLPFFSLLIDRKLGSDVKQSFLEENQVSLASSPHSLTASARFSEGNLLSGDSSSLLSKALKIKIFKPQDLSRAQLRAALGLEDSNEPIPSGVYLIKDDLGLGGVYVEGDLEEMIMAVQDDYQVISFRTAEGCWLLRFSPSAGATFFQTPQGTSHYDLTPQGIIIVRGKINSLGGGIMGADGQAVLSTDEEISSILRGVSLTIISSEKATLTSHLIHQGVKGLEGVPYLKDSTSQLIIFSTGKDFWDGSDEEAGIVVSENAPQNIKIQASLAASGKGFEIQGKEKTVEIQGGLQAANYLGNSNILKISPDERLFDPKKFPANSPETANPILHIFFFEVLEWKEF